MKTKRIMYIESKSGSLSGDARIGLVSFSQTGRSVHYDGKTYLKVKNGYKYNHIEVDTLQRYWISGCKKRGGDRLYGGGAVHIDADIRERYWLEIRNLPQCINLETA